MHRNPINNNNHVNHNSHIHILMVEDEKLLADGYRHIIEMLGYTCSVAHNGFEALRILEGWNADIIITDIRMPDMDGIELIDYVNKNYDSDIIVMTGYVNEFEYTKVMEAGAQDFFYKPVSVDELSIRLRRVLNERKMRQERNQVHSELKGAYLDTIHRLVLATEYKDEDTGLHIVRMSKYSALIAEKMGMSVEEVERLRYAAPMHDVGKIGIPDNILLKPGKLTTAEFDVMKNHTLIGGKILANSKSKILEYAQLIALTHHEKWNGGGYPNGLGGHDIPLPGRIVSIADVFDALTSVRPYKPAFSIEKALGIIWQESAKHFDPEIVQVFFDNIDEIINIRNTIEDEIEEEQFIGQMFSEEIAQLFAPTLPVQPVAYPF